MACVRSLLLLSVLSPSLCGGAASPGHQALRARPGAAARPLVGASWVHTRDVKESLQDVVSLWFGDHAGKAAEVHLPRLRAALRPLFDALPKAADGFLDRSTARYALHRHFTHYHGMYMKGLEPSGREPWNGSSTEIREEDVPGYVMHRFDEFLDGGWGLDELAMFAATLEHFIRLDAVERLKKIYALTNHSLEGEVSEDEAAGLLERFLAIHMTGFGRGLTAADLERRWTFMLSSSPSWPSTQTWLRGIQDSVLDEDVNGVWMRSNGMTFAAVQRVLEVVIERFGRYQDADCKVMHARLMDKDGGNGRVKLSNFYRQQAQGAGIGQFTETKEYLMALGAIEEKRGSSGEVEETYVLIPNYLQSITNCLPSSSVYTVCCLNECEELLRHVEVKVGGPTAAPQELVKIVASLPSATVRAPRVVSDLLVQRLNEIAAINELGGRVPLHGRLFSQWLHHVYPNECPMPARAGTTRPVTADDWLRETNSSSRHTLDEISGMFEEDEEGQQKRGAPLLSRKPRAPMKEPSDALPWDLEEELVFYQAKPSLGDEFRTVLRALAMVGACVGLLLSLAELLSSAMRVAGGGSLKAQAAKRTE